jgi:hypothetical protein
MAKTSVYLKEKSAYDNIFRFSRCKPLKQSTVALEVENIFATGSSPLRIQELQVTFDSPDRYGKSPLFLWSEAADEAQRGSVVPAQIVRSPVATGDDGSRSVISDPTYLAPILPNARSLIHPDQAPTLRH